MCCISDPHTSALRFAAVSAASCLPPISAGLGSPSAVAPALSRCPFAHQLGSSGEPDVARSWVRIYTRPPGRLLPVPQQDLTYRPQAGESRLLLIRPPFNTWSHCGRLGTKRRKLSNPIATLARPHTALSHSPSSTIGSREKREKQERLRNKGQGLTATEKHWTATATATSTAPATGRTKTLRIRKRHCGCTALHHR